MGRLHYNNNKEFAAISATKITARSKKPVVRIGKATGEPATSDNFYRGIVEGLADYAVFTTDPKGNINSWNKGATRFLGYRKREALGKSLSFFYANKRGAKARLNSEIKLAIRNKKSSGRQYMTDKKGQLIWVSGALYPIYANKGKLSGFTKIMRDMTEQKEIEQNLETERQNLEVLFNQAPALIAILRGRKGIIEFFNPTFQKLWNNRKVLGKPMRKAFPELEGQGWFELVEQVYDSRKPVFGTETPAQFDRNNDGRPEEAFFNFVYQPYINAGGETVGVMIHGVEVTDQVMARKAAERSNERLNLAQQAGKIGTFEWLVPENVITWTSELEDLYGLHAGQFEGNFESWAKRIYPDDLPQFEQSIKEALDSGTSYSGEFRVVLPSGDLRWMVAHGDLYYGKDGTKPVRMVGINADITERKEAEEEIKKRRVLERKTALLQKQQEELMALNRAKDEFVSLSSHQLRTPATGVKQYVGMLLEGYAGDITAQQRKLLKIAYASNERQLRIIDDLLRVAQVDAGKVHLTKSRCNISRLLSDIIAEQAAAFRRRGQELVFKKPDKPMDVHADAHLMRMVLENVIDNAGKYSHHGKTVEITLRGSPSRIIIAVKDEGVGISVKQQKELFQKFSRLKNPLSISVGGTGLGLYWAKKVVDLHGGTITAESRLNKGSMFTIKIPRK